MSAKPAQSVKSKLIQQNPLIMRCHRLMEVFAKSDDERDFYLDRQEGFLINVDLDKSQEDLEEFEKELKANPERYCLIPKLTFYEVKKIMEGFVNEKVYDIDTKEKLIDIIQSKEARENFLEFIYDHHSELEKWQQYYQERFRVRIIEWLRNSQFDFVFEEDLEMTKSTLEKLKMNTFTSKAPKDVVAARKLLVAKAKTYYSNEALNPRPKRGRPPKQVAKVETEPQFSSDIYLTVPKPMKPFLFTPDYQGTTSIYTFSGKFSSEADLLAHKKRDHGGSGSSDMHNLTQKLAALKSLSSQWSATSQKTTIAPVASAFIKPERRLNGEDLDEDEYDDEDEDEEYDEDDAFFGKAKAKSPKIKAKAEKMQVGKAKEKFVPAPIAKPVAKPIAKPAFKPAAKPIAKPTFKPAAKPVAKQAFKPAAKPVAKAGFKPVAKPAFKPGFKAAAKPAVPVKPAAKSAPKAHLRPLVKKQPAQAASKEKAQTKKKSPPLRLMRRSKKK